MFQVGDMVVYGGHGVSSIIALEERSVDGRRIRYFVLEPMGQNNARYYVPAENPAALKKMRHVINKEKVYELLDSVAVQADRWLEDDKQRKQYYTELIHGGDHAALMQMIGSLYRHKEKQMQLGRKLHLCDETFLRDAVKIMDAEFSLALGIDQGEVGKYIEEELRERREKMSL